MGTSTLGAELLALVEGKSEFEKALDLLTCNYCGDRIGAENYRPVQGPPHVEALLEYVPVCLCSRRKTKFSMVEHWCFYSARTGKHPLGGGKHA